MTCIVPTGTTLLVEDLRYGGLWPSLEVVDDGEDEPHELAELDDDDDAELGWLPGDPTDPTLSTPHEACAF